MHHRDAMKSHPMTSFPESIPFLARCIWIRRASSKPQTPRFRRGERVYERKLRTGFNARVLRGRPRAHTGADILEYAWSETRTRTHTHSHTHTWIEDKQLDFICIGETLDRSSMLVFFHFFRFASWPERSRGRNMVLIDNCHDRWVISQRSGWRAHSWLNHRCVFDSLATRRKFR